jgi:hypothetical protein
MQAQRTSAPSSWRKLRHNQVAGRLPSDARIPSKLGAILRLDGSDLLVSAKVGVLRHVGRVLAGLRVTAESLCQSTDVMRASAAADSQIADAEIEGFAAEFARWSARPARALAPPRKPSPPLHLPDARRIEPQDLIRGTPDRAACLPSTVFHNSQATRPPRSASPNAKVDIGPPDGLPRE